MEAGCRGKLHDEGVAVGAGDRIQSRIWESLSDKFWDAMAYMTAQFASISNSGAMRYGSIAPRKSTSPTTFDGGFHAPNMSVTQAAALLEPIAQHINATFAPDVIAQERTTLE